MDRPRRGRRRDRRWARSWSPEQIANRLRLDFPDDVSFELFADGTDGLDFPSKEDANTANRPQLTLSIRSG